MGEIVDSDKTSSNRFDARNALERYLMTVANKISENEAARNVLGHSNVANKISEDEAAQLFIEEIDKKNIACGKSLYKTLCESRDVAAKNADVRDLRVMIKGKRLAVGEFKEDSCHRLPLLMNTAVKHFRIKLYESRMHTVSGRTVSGRTVSGRTVSGSTVVGCAVVGCAVVGCAVVGCAVVGCAVVGSTVSDRTVLGSAVVGSTVLKRKDECWSLFTSGGILGEPCDVENAGTAANDSKSQSGDLPLDVSQSQSGDLPMSVSKYKSGDLSLSNVRLQCGRSPLLNRRNSDGEDIAERLAAELIATEMLLNAALLPAGLHWCIPPTHYAKLEGLMFNYEGFASMFNNILPSYSSLESTSVFGNRGNFFDYYPQIACIPGTRAVIVPPRIDRILILAAKLVVKYLETTCVVFDGPCWEDSEYFILLSKYCRTPYHGKRIILRNKKHSYHFRGVEREAKFESARFVLGHIPQELRDMRF